MSAFEDFVQLELPKRPYLETDVATETVLVRRGPGPRQLDAVTLTDGQVLGRVAGVIQGVTLSAGASFKAYSEGFNSQSIWVVTHSQTSTNYLAQVFDGDGKLMIPDEIETTSSSVVTVRFNTPATGTIRLVFLD